MELRPWLCWTAVYRFREVISTSQESESMGSPVFKLPCGFQGFIFSSLPPRLSHSSFYVFFSPLSYRPLLIFFVRSVLFVLPPHYHLPLSQFISHSFSHSRHWPQPAPTQSLFLNLSPRLSPPDDIPTSEVIIRHSARAKDFPQPCLSTRARIGAAATIVSSQVYS